MDNQESTAKHSINLYFQDSSNSDIFDEISSCYNSNDNQKREVETKSSLETTPNFSMDPSSVAVSENVEPVVCKLFAQEKDNEVDKTPDKTFFDNFSNNAEISSIHNLTDEFTALNTSNESGFKYPSAIEHFKAENDAVSDELFMRGSAVTLSRGNLIFSGSADRRKDAWIPSHKTRHALSAVAGSTSGSYSHKKELLTMPGVILEEDMVDTVYQAVNHYLGEEEAAERKVLTINDVTQDERGLRELINAGCYKAAVNLTSRLLTMYGQGIRRAGCPSKHTVHSVQLWFTRIALLMKLKSWSIAWAEAEAWGDFDKPDLYFQFYSELYGGRPGTIVPFSFRLIVAELPLYVHKPQEAFPRLFSLLSIVEEMISNLDAGLSEDGGFMEITEDDRHQSKELWLSRKERVIHSIINAAVTQKNYKLAVELLKNLIESTIYNHTVKQKRALMSASIRTHIQFGNTVAAKLQLETASRLRQSDSVDFQELVDLALLAICEGEIENSYQLFQKALTKDPTNVMVINNMAVCLLYQGKQKEAVRLLEAVIKTNPSIGLNENILLNICTLYELECSHSMENKLKMLKLVSKYKGDSISVSCLKLQVKD